MTGRASPSEHQHSRRADQASTHTSPMAVPAALGRLSSWDSDLRWPFRRNMLPLEHTGLAIYLFKSLSSELTLEAYMYTVNIQKTKSLFLKPSNHLS